MNDRAGAQGSSNAMGGSWAADFLDRLAGQDVRFSLVDGKISVNAPRGALTDSIRAEVAAHRDELIAHLAAAPTSRWLPLSSVQERLWFLDRLDPGSAQYNVGAAYRLKGAWDSSGARATLERLVARHALLNARFRDDSGAARLEILDRSQTEIDVFDFSTRPLAQAQSDAESLARDLFNKSFDMDAGRLAAFLVIKEAADQHLVAICLHHIISDAWSLDLLFREFGVLSAEGAVDAPRRPWSRSSTAMRTTRRARRAGCSRTHSSSRRPIGRVHWRARRRCSTSRPIGLARRLPPSEAGAGRGNWTRT